MFSFQQIIIRHKKTKTREYAYTQGIEQSTENTPAQALMLDT